MTGIQITGDRGKTFQADSQLHDVIIAPLYVVALARCEPSPRLNRDGMRIHTATETPRVEAKESSREPSAR
jgi:hypothetical protein